jgi:hypothetical protein
MKPVPFTSSVFPAVNPDVVSRCLPVRPCGLGTPLQESLPSYLNRLAQAHSLPVVTFLSGELAPLVSPGAHYHSVSNYLARSSRFLLLGGGLASRVAAHVGQLTAIAQVVALVHPLLAESLGWFRDLRGHLAWCPECFHDWSEAHEPLYFPLLWAFKASRCCLRHNVLLRETCSGCGRRFSHLIGRTWEGKCFECQRPFADNRSGPVPSSFDTESTRLAESLVTWATALDRSADFTSILVGNLAAAAAAVGGAKPLSRALGRGECVVRFWLRRKQNPTLGSLLRLSLAFGIPPEHWLSVALDRNRFLGLGSVPKDVTWLSDRATPVPADRIESVLRSSLGDAANSPPSLFALARAIPTSTSHLYLAFPELAARVVERHRVYRAQRKSEHATRLADLVRVAIAERRTQGLPATADAVLRHLGSRWPLSRRRLCAVFREVQRS